MESDSQSHNQTVSTSKTKKKSGSFRIPREAFCVLIENKATAWQIGAYLTLARHTDKSGKFTTAGHKKICSATGASQGTDQLPGAARKSVKFLLEMGSTDFDINKLIYAPLTWNELTAEPIPETPHKLYQFRFVINDYGSEDWIWFPNEIVDGIGKFKQPLKRLKQCGDIAARLLLIAYSFNDMEEFGGVRPKSCFYNQYVSDGEERPKHMFKFYKVKEHKQYISKIVAAQALGVKSLTGSKEKIASSLKEVSKALTCLQGHGYLYEIVTVMDGHPDTEDSRPCYELHNKCSSPNKGEEGLARRIDKIYKRVLNLSKDSDYCVADIYGRYRKILPVISRVGSFPHVVGIYRLRFRISNPKNYTVSSSWKRIGADRQEWQQELDNLEKLVGFGRKDEVKKEKSLEIELMADSSKVRVGYNQIADEHQVFSNEIHVPEECREIDLDLSDISF